MDATAITINKFKSLFVSQLISRIFTFLLNVFSTRSLTPEVYGVAAVQFHLINTTILFVSREGLRRGCMRTVVRTHQEALKVLVIATLAIPAGAILSFVVICFLLSQQNQTNEVYRKALLIQGAAALLELFSEPMYILASTKLLFGLRATIETGATVCKGLVLLVLLQSSATSALVAFSWSQVVYAGVICGGYAWFFWPKARAFYKQHFEQLKGSSRFKSHKQQHIVLDKYFWVPDSQLMKVSGTFALQAIEKLLLAEGSKMAMAVMQDSYSQGIYGLVSNLGSLLVRTLFQPFEEAAFTAFSKLEGGATTVKVSQQWQLLSLLVRAISVVGLIAAAFGPAYSYLVLLVVYSPQWAETEAPAALGLYSQYVVLLAVNGILEAFVHAVANQAQLQRINAWLVAFTVLHLLVSSLGVMVKGVQGLILADAMNMVARILYCLVFIANKLGPGNKDMDLRRMLPSSVTLQVLGVVLLVTCTSRLLLLPESASLLQSWRTNDDGVLAAALLCWPHLQHFFTMISGLDWQLRMALHVLVGVICLCSGGRLICMQEQEVLRTLLHIRGRNVKTPLKRD